MLANGRGLAGHRAVGKLPGCLQIEASSEMITRCNDRMLALSVRLQEQQVISWE